MPQCSAMKRCLVVTAACAALLVNVPTAQAQTERRFGVVIGFPTVGVQWQAADRIAIRFDASYRRSTIESDAIPTPTRPGVPALIQLPVFQVRASSSNTGADLGVSVLFDIHRTDEVRLYLAPHAGVRISRSEFETTITGPRAQLAALTIPANSDSTSYAPSGRLALGASHDVSARLRIFGEAAATYTRGNVDGLAFNDTRQSSLGIGGTVGVVVLF